MKILLTGAHLTPALAMIDYIQAQHPEDELVFVGRLYSQEKLKQKSVEKTEVNRRHIKFIPFQAIKFVGNSWWTSLRGLLAFPETIQQAKKILLQEKVEVFLSFGSYLAVPFALAAKSLQIPVITHEQTVTMGKANAFIAQIADRVAISHKQTTQFLKKKNWVLTGNPVRQQIFNKQLPRPQWLPESPKKILLVMGGNQGSFAINEAIRESLLSLIPHYQVVHQCGRPNVLKDYYAELSELQHELPLKYAMNYVVKEWFSEEELFWLYQHAHFAISRAGANSVLELGIAAVPSILIPLPNASNQEQEKNARLLQRKGGALILPQEQLTARNLQQKIATIEPLVKEMRAQLRQASQYRDAAQRLYQVLAQFKKE